MARELADSPGYLSVLAGKTTQRTESFPAGLYTARRASDSKVGPRQPGLSRVLKGNLLPL